MKTYNLFIVKLDKTMNDTIKTDSGLELYIDTRFDEFENRVTEGPVVAIPFKYNTGVKEGDTLYFHHLVVMNEGQVLTGEDNTYMVRYDPEHIVNNQAIAYKCKDDGTGFYIEQEGNQVLNSHEGFKENRDYRIKVDGKEYYRVRAEDLDYVIKE